MINSRLKYYLLFVLLTLVSGLRLIAQDTSYVNSLIDSAQFEKYRNFKYSVDLTKEALNIARNKKYEAQEINAMNLLGFLHYFYLHNVDSAYQFIYSAYDLSKKREYKRGICEYYVLKGVINQSRGNILQARSCFSKSHELAKEINNKMLLGNSQYGLALVLMQEKLYMVALNTVDKAIKNYREIDDKYGEADALRLKSSIYFENDNLSEAFTNLNNAKKIYTELEDIDRIIESDFSLALYYVERKEYKKALPLLKRFSEYDPQHGDEIGKYVAKRLLGDIYGEWGQYEKAYKLQKEYNVYMDSSNSVEEYNNLTNLQVEYDNLIQEKEKQALQRENELKSLKLRKDKVIIWLAVFTLIQIFVFSVLIYRKYKVIKTTSEELRVQQQLIHEQEKEIERRKSAKIKQNLEYKKRELAVKVFQIFQGNQLTQKLLERLQALRFKIKTRGRLGEEIRNDIQEMINEIKFNSNVQIWEEFEIYFNKTTPGFKKWLTNAYPGLTANEVRLCIFSQLNLKTKEISNITLQSVKSINVARTRLRKKLGIEDPNLSLSSFLLCSFTEYKKQQVET